MTTRHVQLPRLIVPAAAACVAVLLLIGGIPLPGTYQPERGPRPETKIGRSANGGKPLAVGRSTAQNVVSVLGQPEYRSRDGRTVAYHYLIHTGTLVNVLCFNASTSSSARYLVIRYSESGVMESFKVHESIAPQYESGELKESYYWTAIERGGR